MDPDTERKKIQTPPGFEYGSPGAKDEYTTYSTKVTPISTRTKYSFSLISGDTILSEVSNTTQDSLSGTSSRRGSIGSSSSTSTELCDEEPDRLSDFDSDAGINENLSANTKYPSNQHTTAKILEISQTNTPKENISEIIEVPSPEKVAEVIEVFSPESVDNALCVDNSLASASSSASVSPIELDNIISETVPNILEFTDATSCDESVLSVRELDLDKLDNLKNKTEIVELFLPIDKDRLSTQNVTRSRSPQLENVNNHTEALFDLSRKLDEMKAANGDSVQDNHDTEDNNQLGVLNLSDNLMRHSTESEITTVDNKSEELLSCNFKLGEVKSDPNDLEICRSGNNSSLKDQVRSHERRSSSDLELLKILNENSEILNRIQRISSSSMLDSEPKPWKSFDKQRSLDICPSRYEKQNTKWFSSSVDFSTMKLGNFNSKLSFETIDESKELKSNQENEDDMDAENNTSNIHIKYPDPSHIEAFVSNEQTKFGIPNIAEEGENNTIQTPPVSPKPKSEIHKKCSKTFNPFSSKITTRQNKELAIKLGLYSSNECNKSSKRS